MPGPPRRPPLAIIPRAPGWLPIGVPASIVVFPHPIVHVGVPPHPNIPRVVEPPVVALTVNHFFCLSNSGLDICLLRWCILHICVLRGCNLARGCISVWIGWYILARCEMVPIPVRCCLSVWMWCCTLARGRTSVWNGCCILERCRTSVWNGCCIPARGRIVLHGRIY